METDEPTPISPDITVGNENPQTDLTPLVLQMLGEREVNLVLAQRQIAQLQQQVEALTHALQAAHKPKKGEPTSES